MNIAEIQQAIRDANLDGWLFYDFRGSDPLAYKILGMSSDHFRSRRWFYFVPAQGEPVRIVHAIEAGALDALPGRKVVYLPWQQLRESVQQSLKGCHRIAMQYSPMNNIPYVARVDAGTVELVRMSGVEVVSSADLVSEFAATMTSEQLQSHVSAGRQLGLIVHDAFAEIGRRLQAGMNPTEYDIQQYLLRKFSEQELMADHPPIVAVDAHSADPHYEPSASDSAIIAPNAWVLIDAWCKQLHRDAIYADITWTGWIGAQVPDEHGRVFRIVRDARDAAVQFVQRELAAGNPVRGCDVDDACRAVIQQAGLGEFFIHRTGHSLHEAVHGNGANIDNLESRDERRLLPRTCFTVEPGVYLPGRFGVRSEINVYVEDERKATVTGVPARTDPLLVAAQR